MPIGSLTGDGESFLDALEAALTWVATTHRPLAALSLSTILALTLARGQTINTFKIARLFLSDDIFTMQLQPFPQYSGLIRSMLDRAHATSTHPTEANTMTNWHAPLPPMGDPALVGIACLEGLLVIHTVSHVYVLGTGYNNSKPSELLNVVQVDPVSSFAFSRLTSYSKLTIIR